MTDQKLSPEFVAAYAVTEAKSELASAQQELNRLRLEHVAATARAAAQSLDVLPESLDDVTTLLASRLTYDPKTRAVGGANGNTVEHTAREYLSTRPHYTRKPVAAPGAAPQSPPARFAPGQRVDIRDMLSGVGGPANQPAAWERKAPNAPTAAPAQQYDLHTKEGATAYVNARMAQMLNRDGGKR